MQKGVGLAVVELIWYFIALYADNVTWHYLEQSHKNVRATAATNKYDPLCTFKQTISLPLSQVNVNLITESIPWTNWHTISLWSIGTGE
jgi:hypothetical protein